MKVLPVEKVPEGDWLYEIKHDGYRPLAFKEGKDVRLERGNFAVENHAFGRQQLQGLE